MAPQLHQRPPFRAEHLGSLLRPHNLLDVKVAYEKGEVKEAELQAVEDKEITDIVETQKKLGYAAASDGEYRRHSKYSPNTIGNDKSLTEFQQCSGELSSPVSKDSKKSPISKSTSSVNMPQTFPPSSRLATSPVKP